MIKNKFGALAGCAAFALGVAACGSSGSSSSTTTASSGSGRPPSPARARPSRPRLRTVGIVSLAADRQLPGRRLGRRHHGAREQDRRLRRQRPAAEAGRRRSDRQERQPGGADPDVPGRDHRLLQRPRRQDRPEARRQDDRRHLRRQDQDLERTGNRGAEPRRQTAEHGDHRDPPLGLLGHDLRLHELPVRASDPEWKSKVGEGKTVSGRRERERRATPASPARSSRRPERSATSSRPTRSRTTSPCVGEEQVGQLRRADAGLDERLGRRRDGPGQPRHQSHQLAEPDRLPDHLADVHRRQQGPLQGRDPRAAKAPPRAS